MSWTSASHVVCAIGQKEGATFQGETSAENKTREDGGEKVNPSFTGDLPFGYLT